MKKSRAILKRVEKYRQRKGMEIIDQSSKLYLFFKIVYILAFSWYAAVHLLYFFGVSLLLLENVTVYINEFYIICGTTTVAIAGFVLMLLKKHEIGGIMNLVALPIDTYQYYVLHILKGNNIENSVSKFIWYYLAPSVLMFVFCAILCFIALRAKHLLNRDYKKVLEALYISHKDELGSGTEQDWDRLLSKLDDDQLEQELEQQHTEDNNA